MFSHTKNFDYKPENNFNYFQFVKKEKNEKSVAVILPFFNEEDTDLKRTLLSLYNQEQECAKLGYKFYYLAIMDGWFKASESMKDYIYQMFPGTWPSDIENSKNDVETHILQYSNDLVQVDIDEDIFINLSILIKKDNRRKANSHEWFFNSFAKEFDVTFTFATDCGTLYAENCLINLIEYMERHENVAGATGRQRVMSQDMQDINYESYKGMWYRAGQAFDYESSISSFQGSFSLFGMLPVLPGPCGLYRYSDIKGPCLDYYFDVVNNNGPESGLIMGNLLLAEDRILSFAASLLTGKYTRWVPSSVFYFEAETKSMNFITQRRRWTNGALAGYIYLVFMNPKLIWCSAHSFMFKLINYILLLFQFINFMFTSISPGIFIALSARSFKELNIIPSKVNDYSSYVISGVYFLILLTYVFIHFQRKFVEWFYNIVLYFNSFMFLFVLASFIKIIFLGDIKILLFISFSLLTPFILAILHSIDVFIMMLVNFLPFLLFLPTFIPWFVIYSYTRTWDLTWGNRPSTSMDEVKQDKDKVMISLRRKGFAFISIVLLLNAGIIYVLNVYNYSFIIYIASSFLVLALIQQFFSFIYFVFKTDHLLLSSFNKLNKNYIKIIGFSLLCISFALITTSLFTPNWISTSKQIITNTTINGTIVNNTDILNLDYGLLFLKLDYTNNTYKSETVPWGTNVLYDWPNTIWSISIIILFAVFIFIIIVLLTTLNVIFQQDTSRTKHITIFYLLSSCFLLFIVTFLFPFGFKNMTSYKLKWLGIDDLCTNSDIYYLGSCSMSWSYYLFIIGFVFLIIAYNTIKFSEIKNTKENYIKTVKKNKYISYTDSITSENNSEIEITISEDSDATYDEIIIDNYKKKY